MALVYSQWDYDYILGTDENDTLYSDNKNSTILGYEGDDTIYSEGDNALIYLNAGYNYVRSSGANADIFTMECNNVILVLGDNSTVAVSNGINVVSNQSNNTQIYTEMGSNYISSTGNNVSILAGEGSDTVENFGNNTMITTEGGSNFISSEGEWATIDGGDGQDTIYSGVSNSSINTKNGDDIIFISGGGYNTIRSGAGNDTIIARDGNSNIFMYANGSGDDVYVGLHTGDTVIVEDTAVISAVVTDDGDAAMLRFESGSIMFSEIKDQTIIVQDTTGLYALYGIESSAVAVSTISDNRQMYTYDGSASAEINDFNVDSGVLNFTIPVVSLYRNGASLYLTVTNGNVLQVNTTSQSSDSIIRYSSDGGNNVFGAKIADASTDNLTYSEGLTYYSLTNSGSLILNDNSNHNIWLDGSTGSYYNNINNIDASNSSGNDILSGNWVSNNIYAGSGRSTLWGGSGGDNLLVGGTASDQFRYTGGGNDIAQNFTSGRDSNADVAVLMCDLAAVKRSGSEVVLTAANGNSMRLMTNIQSTDEADIQYSVDGNNIYTARFAADNLNSVTYSNGINFYSLEQSGTLIVQGDESYNIYLDGTAGVGYGNVANIDASNSTGHNNLNGDSQSNEIRAGNGGDQLWGGAGDAFDILYGGAGADTFYYLKENGNDIINNATAEDTINLSNVTLADITAANVTDNSIALSFNSGYTLTVNDYGNTTTATFNLASGETYRYNRSSGQWQSN